MLTYNASKINLPSYMSAAGMRFTLSVYLALKKVDYPLTSLTLVQIYKIAKIGMSQPTIN